MTEHMKVLTSPTSLSAESSADAMIPQMMMMQLQLQMQKQHMMMLQLMEDSKHRRLQPRTTSGSNNLLLQQQCQLGQPDS